jgi:zinc transport system ATP-binding protein
MPQLTCQNLSLGYEGKTVVSNLSFTVHTGDYLCVVGENGSGKTTMMKTILKLHTPLTGQIQTGSGLTQKEIGYLPQRTMVQKDFPASVREVVRSGLLNRCGLRPYYTKDEKHMADVNMEKLGILPLAARCYRELSGGQQQRALLARALCAARKILLLDEPAAGLDPEASLELYHIIRQLNNDGLTIVMVSHDIAEALQYASHILHIGKQHFFGTTEDYIISETGRAYAELGCGQA